MAFAGVALLAVVSALLAARHGSWAAPGPLFVGFWAFEVALPTLAGYPGSAWAVASIVGLVLCWAAGSGLAADARRDRCAQRCAVEDVGHRRVGALGVVVAAGAGAGFAAGVLVVYRTGFELSALTTVGGLFDVGSKAAFERYEGRSDSSPTVSALLMLAYLGALSSPRWLLFRPATRRRTLASTSPLIGTVMYSAVSTARTAMVLSLALWTASYIACRTLLDRPVRLRPRMLVRIGCLVAVFGVLFIGIAFIRVGGVSSDQVSEKVLSKVESYAFGYLPAFSAWQSPDGGPTVYFAPRPELWGALTFNGVARFLGADREAGEPYPEFVVVDDRGNKTNIYTLYRGLLEDFGAVGAPLVMTGGGFVSTRAYFALRRRESPVALAAVTAAIAFTFFSSTCSIFFFTNICIALLVDAVIVRTLLGVRPPAPPPERASIRVGTESP
jgi:oligosaccharide repeat unit polymerase